MLNPTAGGKRFILNSETAWYAEIIDVLRAHVPSHRKKLPRFGAPREVLGWQPRSMKEAVQATASSLIELGMV